MVFGHTHSRRAWLVLLALATLFAAAAVYLPRALPVADAAVPSYSGWTLIWSDDFNGPANTGVDTTKWIYDTGTGYPGGPANWGTGEIETMTSSTANVFQDGAGNLNIKPIRDASGNWTSGRIETVRTDFQPPAGGVMRVEARIQLPNVTGASAQGYWPAFWMLGAPFRGNYWNWPSIGEIDIMENVNGANTVWGTFHCGVTPGGPCNETSGIGASRSGFSPSLQSAFHTYRVEWDRSVSPEEIRWYVDDVQYHTVRANQFDATTWQNATNHGYFIILNVAIGGGWPGNPTSSTVSGAPMKVDYVAVWTKNGGTSPTPTPSPTATPTPTPNTEYTFGVDNLSGTQARVWFKPNGWTANYVILHYIVPGQPQQNVYMTYNSSTARWEYTVSGISSGQTLQYQFTYNKNGLQYDTTWFSWTKP